MRTLRDLLLFLEATLLGPMASSAGGAALVFTVLVVALAPTIRCGSKEKAYLAAMKSDLRNLVVAQEAHRDEFGRFATALPADRYRTSSGVRLVSLVRTPSGFRAEVAYPEGTTKRCRIVVDGDQYAEPTCDW